jgi:predicted nuclease of predicted toxin-antitoxin system
LSLKLIVDEDSLAKPLIRILREAEHDVITVNEVGLSGQCDSVVLNYARENARIVLTHNCRDFKALHLDNSNHPGILAVYRDTDFSKNMSRQDIVKAIANLEASGIPLTNQFIALNHWNY